MPKRAVATSVGTVLLFSESIMFLFGIFLVSLVLGANATLSPIDQFFINTFDTNNNDTQVNYRLPNDTVPISYDISLKTNVHAGDFNFTGTVIINLKTVQDTKTITVHARQLTITNVKLENWQGTLYTSTFSGPDKTTEFLTITSSRTLFKDLQYRVTIDYSGELWTDLKGFYRSSYQNPEGETKYLATTQFESTDARHAFPCYDEPGLKATFTLHITHGKDYSAISNMPVDERNEIANDTLATTNFKETPSMSPYLIAFLVSDFDYTESKNNSQRVYAAPHYKNWTSYALDEGISILKAIGDYVQVNFTLPKMDQAAIPDFAAGEKCVKMCFTAMENWGLVTYREASLLYDPAIHLPERKLSITRIIAHEFGHQWFGDLVSPKWWSYIWLNEGFATISEPIGVNAVHSDWDYWSYFVSTTVQPVLRVDATAKARPMTYYTEDPAGIANLFDSMVYAKAGSVIRMFMHVLGEEAFKKGLKYYLEEKKLSAAEEDDLFKNLDKAAKEAKVLPEDVNVKTLFSSWSQQTGFPVLRVERNYENGTIVLTQEKYDDVQSNQTAPTTWWVPFNFATANSPSFDDTKPSGWLKQNQSSLVLKWSNSSSWNGSTWVVFNKQQAGYYRVMYDEENYKLINKELNNGDVDNIHPINRAQILDDLNEFVNSGRLPGSNLCHTILYLKNETSYAAWIVANRVINQWKNNLQASKKSGNFKTVVKGLVEPYYKKFNLEEDEKEIVMDKLARNLAVNLACEFDVEACLVDTYTHFKTFLKGTGDKPSQNLRGVIVANGIRRATEVEVEDLWKRFLASSSTDESQEIISSLGNMKSDWFGNYLKKSITENNGTISTAERQQIIIKIISNSQKGVEDGIKFLSENMEGVKEKQVSVVQVLQTIAARVMTDDVNTKFITLLDSAKNGTINEGTYESLKKTATDTIAFRTNVVDKFEKDFFENTGCSSAASFAAIPLLSFIMFCVTRFNWL